METENAIEVRQLTKKFAKKTAVQQLSFDVPKGSITGFIGPNGAGKTTTLRMLATLLKPDYGSIKVFGNDCGKKGKQVRHLLGFMPDYFGLYEDMEVEEYLDFFAAAYHITIRQRRQLIADLLDLLDLSVKKNALINELSRGMQQRLSLARSLVHDPKLLLLDEPASGLDPRARIELMALLRELRSMGKTIFVSSHILAELKDLCDFVVIIERGQMVYNGTVSAAAESISGEKVKLRLLIESKAEQALELIKPLNGITDISADDKSLTMEYEADKIDSAKIIKLLVNKDFAVQEAVKQAINLEDVFMTLTEGGIA